jgi:hypothetical protein
VGEHRDGVQMNQGSEIKHRVIIEALGGRIKSALEMQREEMTGLASIA